MKKENINEVFNLWFSNKMDNVHTILPGKIVNYEGHEKRKAEVKIMVQIRNVHNQIIEIDPIKNVPVVFPSTDKFNMLFPLEKGDGCLLLFSESSIGNFLLNDTDNAKEADDLNRFDFSDCICVPGLWSFRKLPTAPDNDDDFWLIYQDSKIRIIKDTGEIYIEDKEGNKIYLDGTTGITIEDTNLNKVEMTSSGIKITDANSNTIEMAGTTVDINGNSKKFVTYTELNNAITAFIALLNSHTHSGVTAGGGTSGSPSSPMTLNISASESQKARTG